MEGIYYIFPSFNNWRDQDSEIKWLVKDHKNPDLGLSSLLFPPSNSASLSIYLDVFSHPADKICYSLDLIWMSNFAYL